MDENHLSVGCASLHETTGKIWLGEPLFRASRQEAFFLRQNGPQNNSFKPELGLEVSRAVSTPQSARASAPEGKSAFLKRLNRMFLDFRDPILHA
jgi:hypothetical protein